MSKSMKERIAEAISVTGHTEEFALFCAEAALTELENPTDEMIEAGKSNLADVIEMEFKTLKHYCSMANAGYIDSTAREFRRHVDAAEMNVTKELERCFVDGFTAAIRRAKEG